MFYRVLNTSIAITLHKKSGFPLRISSVMWPNPEETVDLVAFTAEISNGKLYFCPVLTTLSTGRLMEGIT